LKQHHCEKLICSLNKSLFVLKLYHARGFNYQ
jgi:hypothetical protein